MASDFNFTVNIYIDNVSLIDDAVSSYVKNRDFFLDNIQLVLIDSLCTAESTAICFKYTDRYPDNICFVDCCGKSAAESYNEARVVSAGTFISFVSVSDVYSENTFPELLKSEDFSKANIICLGADTARRGSSSKPYNFGAKEGKVSIKLYPDRVGLILGAYLFRRTAIANNLFDPRLQSDYYIFFILELLSKYMTYSYLPGCRYITMSFAENDIQNNYGQYFKEYFVESTRMFIIPMLKKYNSSPLVMNVMMYLLYVKFACGLNDRFKFTLSSGEVNDFFNIASEAMQLIDDAVIMNKSLARRAKLPPELAFKILRLKYKNKYLKPDISFYPVGVGSEYEFRDCTMNSRKARSNGCFTAMFNGTLVTTSDHIDVKILALNIKNSTLHIEGNIIDISCLDRLDYEVFAVVNRKKIPLVQKQCYSLTKLFEVSFDKAYGFGFDVPLNDDKEMLSIAFFIALGGMTYRLKFSFGSVHAHLTERLKNSYCVLENRLVAFDLAKRQIYVRRVSQFMISRMERELLSEIKSTVSPQMYLKIKRMRKKFHSTREKYKNRKIWVMSDSTSSLCNDGYRMYKYISEKESASGVEPYYSVADEKPDNRFLAAISGGNIVNGTLNQRLTVMNADVIIADGRNIYRQLGFDAFEEIYYRDLLNADIISFGGNLSMNRNADKDNKQHDNVSLRLCCSEQEKQRLLHPAYGYEPQNVVVSGYPHLDEFKDSSGNGREVVMYNKNGQGQKQNKQILICPAWRRELEKYEKLGFGQFMSSTFFKVYNDILRDGRLTACLEKYGYKIVLVLPKAIEKTDHLWSNSKIVTVTSFAASYYQQLVEQSSMLITDYHPIHFDFSYLKKPIVYYQSRSLAPQNNAADFNYAQDGFGKVFYELDGLVSEICELIEKGCICDREYAERSSAFFAHSDRNNCKRIFDTVFEFEYGNVVKGRADKVK